ncbi:uncharacterized protein SPAPADRAFT_58520 [Spathaspora passalidarum NRRL Y-27907]|uniref:Uncharacterized protein n=1 Tax=Spathaspora passalidarum (strain NRRL Y-27907 / 11-Y1) TaxID=619300 RepID=G3AGG0_SPAPN|nr:uncharacterized protein SPAPADRAFT_58520 [Spathaspora passalidarum NRRL Y-27907]EGW35299.1 hypothetical protein SPAPADRAFT_58520 [Spathaspora passalidarum NRRL Y-27907]
MPPQIAFISVQNQAIPLKIFVQGYSNHSTSSDKKSLAINSKSLITLKNKFQVRLSQAYINTKVLPIIHDRLVELVTRKDNDESSSSSGHSGHVSVDEKGVKVVVPVKVLQLIRHRLGIEYQMDPNIDRHRGDMRMLVRQSVFVIPREDDGDTIDINSDDKKRQRYKMKSKMIVGDLSDCIRVYMSV